MEFEAATNSNGTVSPIRGILSLASDDAAAAEEAFPELAEEAAVKEEGEAKPPPENRDRVGEGSGDSSVANVTPFDGKIEVKEEAGVAAANASSSKRGSGAATETTDSVTVATSNSS